ncbi:MAG TPA: fused MFS/spermidine synthase [Vicinamibacterales bacterium]|nr:fused MFS/spermidine synthase [Vicinamibacterales bacterium]
MRRGPFLILFAVSGAAALIYEVVWTRLLTLHMGHGLAAASAVLAAFMGGLAAGAGAAGRYAGTLPPRRALTVYAALEITIGALAILMPFLLIAVRPLLASTYADGDGGATFAFVRLATSVVVLCVPAACMGATFPIASRWIVRAANTAAQDAGGLYAANTLGAAGGAVLAGFILIPALGLRGTTFVGVALNLIAAGGAWGLMRSAASDELLAAPSDHNREPGTGNRKSKKDTSSSGSRLPDPGTRIGAPWLAAIALGASGFASLTLQVVWTRLLVQILGPTTYAFSIVVAIFIIGIAGGAAIASRLAPRAKNPAVGLAFTLLISVGLALAAASAVDWALLMIGEIVSTPDYQFSDVLLREVVLVSALLLPMTLAFGAAFPFAIAMGGVADDSVTEQIGVIYAINTLGAILGSLLAGFVLVPSVGLHLTIRIVAGIGTAAAIAILVLSTRGRSRIAGVVFAVAVIIAIVIVPQWDPALLSSGAYKYASQLRTANLESALTAGELLWYREGSTGTVAVRRLTGTISLAIDGKVDASNAGDMLTQRMLAHVPLLLHPNPRRAAIIGLGSGVTLGSALRHPITEATVLEISPEVVAASRFFEAENYRALSDPRTRVVVGDGRTHLMLGTETYDVIVSEPSNPWMAGIASLFTREFFEGARARLAPGGVLCQWAHTYDISNADLRSIVATFLSVFPDGTLWLVGDADVLLVASNQPLDQRIAGIAAAMQRPGVAEDLASIGATRPFSITSLFVAEGDALKAWANGAPLQTDDRSALEFSGPRSIFGTSRDDNASALRELASTSPKPSAVATALAAATPEDFRDRGFMLLKAEAFQPAYEDLARTVESHPDDTAALDGLIRAAASINKIYDLESRLRKLAADPTHKAAQLALSRVLASQGNIDQAVRIPVDQLQADPGDVPALEQLASILSDIGDAGRLEPVVQRLIKEAPKNTWSHYYAASLFFIQGRLDLAVQAARNSVAIDPSNGKAHNLIGACLASTGQTDAARTAFETSIKVDPREAGTYANLATLELQSANRDRAKRYFSEALTIDPNNQVARDGLATLLANSTR